VSHDLERIRDYVEGRLAPAEREAFAAEMRRDAALAELVEAYELVVHATEDAAPAATTTVADVLARAGARRRPPFALLAAAALLLVAAGAWLLGSLGGEPPPLALAAIAGSPLPAPSAAEWPRELLSHSTADEEGLIWQSDLGRALALARAAGRPVFLFIDYPGCPLCRDFRANQCMDERVAKAAEAFVLLNLPWTRAPEDLRKDPNQGWPIYAVLDLEGKRIGGYVGMKSAAELAGWLERTASGLREGFAYRDWVALGEGARRLSAAEREEDPGRRYGLYRQMEADDSVLGEVARARLAAMAKEAQDALFAARDSADPRPVLSAASRAFRGTPYGADFDRVLAHVDEHGSFPRLKETR
jgi:hypothetical protein